MGTKKGRKKGNDLKLKDAIQYIEDRKEKLIELENQIELITKDPEWLKAKSYIRVAVNSGKLDETPCKRNNYRKPEYIYDDIVNEDYDDIYDYFL